MITDLNSTNGTWVNGARIAGPTVMRPGDEVRLGDSVCRLESPRAAPVPPAPIAPAPVARAGFPATAPAPAGSAPPAQPFGAFAAAPGVSAPVKGRRKRAATRLPAGVVFAWALIGLDAAALIVYFAAR